MKGVWIKYSDEEMAWLEANRLLPISDYAQAFNAAFGRDVAPGNLHALRKRKGWKTGRTGQFGSGLTPWNKGTHFSPPGSEKTRFKKGQLPHNTKWAGHERVSKDGYVEISVEAPNPYTGYERHYVLKHLHLWEAANGPIPEGHCLKVLDGDRTNTDPANWQLIPRALLPTLNGGRHKRRPSYDDAPQEVKPVLLTLARVEAKARELRRGKAAA